MMFFYIKYFLKSHSKSFLCPSKDYVFFDFIIRFNRVIWIFYTVIQFIFSFFCFDFS